jgi:hypothetical protein
MFHAIFVIVVVVILCEACLFEGFLGSIIDACASGATRKDGARVDFLVIVIVFLLCLECQCD